MRRCECSSCSTTSYREGPRRRNDAELSARTRRPTLATGQAVLGFTEGGELRGLVGAELDFHWFGAPDVLCVLADGAVARERAHVRDVAEGHCVPCALVEVGFAHPLLA